MNEDLTQAHVDQEQEDAQKRVKKIKKFYKELASWAGTSIFLIALNLFLSGSISWAKYPVFFWGITLVYQYFQVLRYQRLDKEWERKMMRKFTGRNERVKSIESTDSEPLSTEDYTEELLRDKPEKEPANLSDYRTLKKPWEDKDLV